MKLSLVVSLGLFCLIQANDPVEMDINDYPSLIDPIVDYIADLFKSEDTLDEFSWEAQPRHVAYDVMVNFFRKQFSNASVVEIPELLNSSFPIEAEGVSIFGLNETFIGIKTPTALSYNIQNLTLQIPELRIKAERYRISNLNLGGLLTLNGDGALNVVLKDIQLYQRVDVKYITGGPRPVFGVTKVYENSFYLESSLFEVENLGSSGKAMERLLNGIATKVLPQLIRAASQDLMDYIIIPTKGDCTSESLYPLCNAIGVIMTGLRDYVVNHSGNTNGF